MDDLHNSVLCKVLAKCSPRTKALSAASCKLLHEVLSAPENWTDLSFEDAASQAGLNPEDLLILLKRSKGRVETVNVAKSDEAVTAQERQRFARGLRFSQPVPYTLGLRAFALAGLLPNLMLLSLDERTSCIGGMTDDFASALAARCPRLRVLEVLFRKYSLPSELFSDAGMIRLSEGCPQLQELLLRNTTLGDRSLYALAANCRGLRRLQISGYSEFISDCGLSVLAETCSELRTVVLGSRLLRVTDATTRALLQQGCPLQQLKLSLSATDESLQLLAADEDCCGSASDGAHTSDNSGDGSYGDISDSGDGSDSNDGSDSGAESGGCGYGLRELDVRRNSRVSAPAVLRLAQRCRRLSLLRLPLRLACLQVQLEPAGWARRDMPGKEWFELRRCEGGTASGTAW